MRLAVKPTIIVVIIAVIVGVIVIPGVVSHRKLRASNMSIKIKVPPKPKLPKMSMNSSSENTPYYILDSVDLSNKAWLVQLNPTGQFELANSLADKLRNFGISAYIKLDSSSQQHYQVIIGPVVRLSQAKQILTEIQHDTALKGHVSSYQPTASKEGS